MPLQEPTPRTLAKQGDEKDKAMAMGPGADHTYDNKLNANLPVPRSRGKGQRSVKVARRVETDFRCGSRKYSPWKTAAWFLRDKGRSRDVCFDIEHRATGIWKVLVCFRRGHNNQCGLEVENKGKTRRHKEDNLAGDAIDPPSNTKPHCVLKFLRSWLPLELQWPRWCLIQCAGCAASEQGRAR